MRTVSDCLVVIGRRGCSSPRAKACDAAGAGVCRTGVVLADSVAVLEVPRRRVRGGVFRCLAAESGPDRRPGGGSGGTALVDSVADELELCFFVFVNECGAVSVCPFASLLRSSQAAIPLADHGSIGWKAADGRRPVTKLEQLPYFLSWGPVSTPGSSLAARLRVSCMQLSSLESETC